MIIMIFKIKKSKKKLTSEIQKFHLLHANEAARNSSSSSSSFNFVLRRCGVFCVGNETGKWNSLVDEMNEWKYLRFLETSFKFLK